MVFLSATFEHFAPLMMLTPQHMRYLGEYVIPIAALVLVLVVELKYEIVGGGRLVKQLFKRLWEKRERTAE